MKRNQFFFIGICIASIGFMSFTSLSSAEETTPIKYEVSEIVLNEFHSSMCEISLIERFEVQFSDMFERVEKVDAHFNEERGFYYAVYGISPEGESVVDFFKTSEHEVSQGIYNYIEMNERTLALTGSRKCREDFTNFPNWCSPYNDGYICGYVPNPTYPNQCVYY